MRICVFRGSVPYGWTLANWLVFNAIRQAIGLDRCQFFLASAAPMMKETLEFFHSLNIPVMEIYGMSECSGKSCVYVNCQNYSDANAGAVTVPIIQCIH